ncbi:MAG: alpha/beta hydrolase family protein [Thermoleophilia bacterium]
MSPASRRCAVAMIAAAMLAPVTGATPATAAPLPPAPRDGVAPVAGPVSADPVGPAQGTLIMVHAGGWAGHDAAAQHQLMARPGALFLRRGWRVVSIDYHAGAPGLQDVLAAVGTELARRTGEGPLCLYGESAGAHLALVAASRLRAIRCVIGIGAPTDLPLYQAEAASSADGLVKLVASQATRSFGTTLGDLSRWDPVTLAPTISADTMLLHERDDPIVSAQHARRMQAARSTIEIVELQSGDRSSRFVHGSVSASGLTRYSSALAAFADRAVSDRKAERIARRTRCPRVGRSLAEIGPRRLRDALRCLARRRPARDAARHTRWRGTRVLLRGEINAARVWWKLCVTKNGRKALSALAAGRATVAARAGQRSQVTLRSTTRRGDMR